MSNLSICCTDTPGNYTQNGTNDKVDFISDEALTVISLLVLVVPCSIISLFGIVFNVFNIVVFVKQGLNDTVNIGLMGLSVADLFSLITLEMMCVFRTPLFYQSVDINVFEVHHVTAAWPHVTMAKISSWITAYIMLERCLCVVVPLKIKTIITPRVTISVIVSIFVFMFLTVVPEYATCSLAWRFDPGRNRSILGLVFLAGREEMAPVSFNISAGTQLGSFGAVILLTSILVVKVKQKSKWRKATSSQGQDSSKNDTSNRDQKTIKMIILVAVIYCVCFLPMICGCITTCLVPMFIVFGAYSNSFLGYWCFVHFFECVNATVNIFVYHRMSTKYRITFNMLVRRKE